MPNTKISALVDGAPALLADQLVIARAGSNYRVTSGNVLGIGVQFAQGGLSLSTTGTSEEVLKNVDIPAGALTSGSYMGFSVLAMVSAAANTNSKTPRFRIGGIGGTIISTFSADATSANRFQFNAVFTVISVTSLAGQCSASRVTGTSFLFGTATLSGLDLASALGVTITGETPTSAGDLTLTAMRVALIPTV